VEQQVWLARMLLYRGVFIHSITHLTNNPLPISFLARAFHSSLRLIQVNMHHLLPSFNLLAHLTIGSNQFSMLLNPIANSFKKNATSLNLSLNSSLPQAP
jgi:hypothetical protein